LALSEEEVLRQIEIRIKRSMGEDTGAQDRTIFLKKGPQAYKVATLRFIRSPRDRRVVKRELKVQTFRVTKMRGVTDPERPWSCENEEIDALRTFLEVDQELGESTAWSGRERMSMSSSTK
jgi:hypothetical protein